MRHEHTLSEAQSPSKQCQACSGPTDPAPGPCAARDWGSMAKHLKAISISCIQADQLVRKGNGIRRTKTRFFSFCLLLLLSNSKLTCLLLWWHFRMWIIKKTQLKSQTTEMKPSRNASLFTLLIFCCCQLQTQSETVTTFTSIHALFHITSYRDCGKPSSTDLQFEAKQNLAAEMNGSDSWNMGFGSSSRSDPFSILAPTKQLTECHLMVKMFYSWTLEPNTVAEYIWKTNIRIIDKMLILSA